MRFFWVVFLFVASVHASEKVRVRIATIRAPQIEVQGLSLSFQGEVSPYQKVSIPQSSTVRQKIQIVLQNHLDLGSRSMNKNDRNALENNSIPYFKRKWTYILDEQTRTIEAPYLALQGEMLQINSQSVPSRVFLWARDDGRVDVIAVLDLEDYLLGVLPHEMPMAWPEEALKAQAILARTFTYKQISARKNQVFHLDSNVNDQMYRYNGFLNSSENLKLGKILEETKDLVLVDGNKKPVKALYHADCGGQTEKSSRVWGQKEIEFSVKDSNCPSTPYSTWSFEITNEELQEKLKLSFLPKSIRTELSSESQRVQSIQVATENTNSSSAFLGKSADVARQLKENLGGSFKTEPVRYAEFSSQDFRRLVGYTKIKSTRFQITQFNNKIYFKGSGFGHGVGMCQWGARGWAQAGLNYKRILNHYFPSYTVVRLSQKAIGAVEVL